MLCVSNTTSTGASQTLAQGAAFVNGNATGRYLWCPTAMDLTDNGTAANSIVNDSTRTATTCFMRGVSEHIRIQTSSGLPWFHRRICFTARNPNLYTKDPADNNINPVLPYVETSNGYQRLMLNQTINQQSNTTAQLEGYLFKGLSGNDWTDILLAPIDTTRVDLKFDKTWTYKSGNTVGTVAERKLWHGMNKNLYYDDDETGNSTVTKNTSVLDKRGMGDYFIYDIFSPGYGGTSTDQIIIVPNSTLYWHEK